MQRYIRQLSLPEIDLIDQERLSNSTCVIVGAGGLGTVIVPYLAGAGVGRLVVIDHDTVDVSNLHRQTIYTTAQVGQYKAECARDYALALNPDITIDAITEKITSENIDTLLSSYDDIDLLIDGSDNFETKRILNSLSIKQSVPFLSASVDQFAGQLGFFHGYTMDAPCYRCLFPTFPTDARNCNEAGILGTSAGMVGMMQAHMVLCYLLNIDVTTRGNVTTIDLRTFRMSVLNLHKDSDCLACQNVEHTNKRKGKHSMSVEMISIEQLADMPSIIVDVRQADELIADPLTHGAITETPLHIPLPEFVARIDELPTDKRLAFVCAGNIRSRKAADYLKAQGRDDVCVLDKFSL